VAAIERANGPTLLALTRQNVPMLPGDAKTRREGMLRGGYVLVRETSKLETILLASGSEVQHCVAAAKELGTGTRVVSLPCWARFDRQDAEYRESVLPKAVERRVSIEAGVTLGWERYVGTRGKAIGIDHFGASAPGNLLMEKFGMMAKSVVEAVKSLG
jgi:transketolase